MSSAVTASATVAVETRPVRMRRLRRVRRIGSWLLLTGWIVLPLMPVLALVLSRLLGLAF